MPAARAVSTADISRTSRACLRTAPNDGATSAPVLQWDDENTVEHTSVPWSTGGTAVAGASSGGGPETPLPRMPERRERAMTDQVDRTVVTEDSTAAAGQETVPAAAVPVAAVPVAARQETVRTDSRHIMRTGPGASEMTRRVIILLFGLIQIVIGARIVLLLLDARTGNALVSSILDISKIFVAPFNGILNKDYLTSGGSVLDIAAILAFVGWTLLELIVIWAVGVFRREPAGTQCLTAARSPGGQGLVRRQHRLRVGPGDN